MTRTPSRPSSSPSVRERRKQALLSALGRITGATALIVMTAALLHVASSRARQEPPAVSTTAEALALAGQPKAATAPGPRTLPLLGRHLGQPPPSEYSLPLPVPGTQQASPVSLTAVNGIERIEDKRETISAALRHYFTADSVAEKARVVRDSSRVLALMQQHYQSHPIQPSQWKDLGWTLPIDQAGYRLGYVQALFHDAPPVSIIIEEDSDGRILIDWESSVRHGELPWRAFLETRPTHPTLMRVLASRPPEKRRDSYAAIERGMEVLELRHPAEAKTVYGSYNPHDPHMAALLEQMEAGRWSQVPVTLRLAYPQGATENNAVLIRAVEGRGWLILSQPRS